MRGALALTAVSPLASTGVSAASPRPKPVARSGKEVWLVGDTPRVTPQEIASRLLQLSSAPSVSDRYLQDGAVTALESRFAEMLGKEACAFFPTGTLANTVAVRALCGDHSRALCQADSHLYRDESDAVPRLTEINLVPLSPGEVAPNFKELVAAFDAAEKGPYPLKVGAVSLESPVRRLDGRMIPLDRLDAIASIVRSHGARLHLDGARLLLAPPSIDVQAYASRFDTVLISLYKYLGAPFGSVLAGSSADIAAARDWRHIQGGLIFGGWQSALLALDGLKVFRRDITRAHATSSSLIGSLEERGVARARPVDSPSNIIFLEMAESRAAAAFERGAARGIHLGPWREGVMPIQINTSILRRPVSEYLSLFE